MSRTPLQAVRGIAIPQQIEPTAKVIIIHFFKTHIWRVAAIG
jgi:hypothetical protein